MLERALELAERGRGTTHPNPVVGAVVVRDGEVVGEGWHERKGGPHAEVVALEAAGELVDLVHCMSIHPGYSGQPFMSEAIPRVRRLRELLPERVYVQVDGGVGPDNVTDLREAGATLLVAGTSVFGQDDIGAAYQHLSGL